MERHDIENELAIPGAQELLTSATMTRLAYLGPDGTPRVIPIGFYWTGDQVVVSTAATAPKVAARKIMDADAMVQFEQACRAMYDQMARIAITPGWVRYFDFGAGRLPRFLQDLAERSHR